MKFKKRTLIQLADLICGNCDDEEKRRFLYRSSSRLTEFFRECETDYEHDGSTRRDWVAWVLAQLLEEPQQDANRPPDTFLRVIQALEYGKDLWMKYTLPTQHVLYFGVQAKKGKIDASGKSQARNSNVAELHNQALMMLAHEVFDPEIGKRVLVDHAFIIAGGEITKAARNWLGNKLDASKRSQILFMDRDDILNLYVVTNLPLPEEALSSTAADDNELPF
jgi:hypothetical protein